MMDEPTDDVAIHRIAIDHFERALRALNALIGAVEAGEVDTARAAKDSASDLRKAMQVLFEERRRVDALCLKEGGDDETQDFDLDDARQALECRLDRLAAESDPD